MFEEEIKQMKESNLDFKTHPLKNNKDFVTELLKQKGISSYIICNYSSLNDDPDIAKLLIDKDVFSYKYLSDRLKADMEIMRYTLKDRNGNLLFSDFLPYITLTKELIMEFIQINPTVYKVLPLEWKKNKEISLFAISKMGTLYVDFCPLKKDADIFLCAIENTESPYSLYKIIKKFQNKANKDALLFALEKLYNTEASSTINRLNQYKYVPKEIFNNPEAFFLKRKMEILLGGKK